MLPKIPLTSFVFLAALAQAAPTVILGNTTLTGAGTEVPNVEFYGGISNCLPGIPYAEPPVCSLRFKAPVLKRALNTPTFNASTYGPPCLQQPDVNPGALSPSSEDCLTLNVYKPAGLADTDSLPVMAWIHGGGLVAGGSQTYDASALVAQSISRGTPVVYVSLNYRLGTMGFPQGREASSRKAVNIGFRDQLMALQWIQDNIRAFNGDKSKVTVFGESAGAASIGILFLNSNLEKLARAAILESGSASITPVFYPSRRQVDWDNFVRDAGCAESLSMGNSIGCLQSADTSALLQAISTSSAKSNESYPWGPVVDGPDGLIPDLPSVMWEKGKFARIPFMTGSNLDEGTFFTTPLMNSTARARAYLISNYTTPAVPFQKLEATVGKILELYPDVPALGSPFNTGNKTFGLSSQYKRYAALLGDIMIQSPRRAWIQAASQFGVKTFGYLFTDPAPPRNMLKILIVLSVSILSVTHIAEIPYVYGAEAFIPNTPASSVELSKRMVDYWVSFATSLDPNDGLGSARPAWSQYRCGDEVILQLNGNDTKMIPDAYRAEQIAFINANLVVFSH
ncbi:extracellular triacylglycerol lipase precursor [Mycena latifolia]|nr:extracellular triacylglycerol lipase precursor [Mycena latifolia]